MKRLSKKLIALVMAMTMVLAMGVTSFAATPDEDDLITVPVKVEIVNLPSSYSGSQQVGVIFNGNVTIDTTDQQNPTVMDFIDATGLTISKSSDGQYISAINGVANYDETYTSNYYKGYSWMIDLKAGSSVTLTGTAPSWADPAPSANAWFSSPLAATNVNMNGSQFFPYDYSDQSAGFTTSVEGIVVKYVMTEASW